MTLIPQSPSRKRPPPPPDDFDNHPTSPSTHTPQTRRRLLRECMPVTPLRQRPMTGYASTTGSTPASYVPSPRSDGLDALAAVACTTSPTPIPSSPFQPKSTLFSSSTSPSSSSLWLSRLCSKRPELSVVEDTPPLQVPTTKTLRGVVPNDDDWVAIVRAVRIARAKILCSPNGTVSDADRYARDASIVYFTALDGLLRDEAARLGGANRAKLSGKLIRNRVFHDSLIALSWECAAAASGRTDSDGRYDMRMLWMAMDALELSPFALTKVLEAFVKRFTDMPSHVKRHMMTCDARIVEARIWERDSEFVRVMATRMSSSSVTNDEDSRDNGGKWGKEMNAAKKPEQNNNGMRSKDVVLQMVYKKVLGLGSLRAQELLLVLGLDSLANAVWTTFKACVWDHWDLMVDRHLDQIVMCCVYGVAKVRRVDVKFKEIVALYRTLEHVRHPSFTPLIHGVLRQVSLSTHPVSYRRSFKVTDKCSKYSGEGANVGNTINAVKTRKSDTDKKDKEEYRRRNRIGEEDDDDDDDEAELDDQDEDDEDSLEDEMEEEEQWGDVIKFYNDVFIPAMKTVLLRFQNTDARSKCPTHPLSRRNEQMANGTTGIFGKSKIDSADDVGNTISSDIYKPQSVSEKEGRREKEKDALRHSVLASPMRSLRMHSAQRRIGRVTIGAMSPGESTSLKALCQSPVRRAYTSSVQYKQQQQHLQSPMMTPGTRTLFAFESPGVFDSGGGGGGSRHRRRSALRLGGGEEDLSRDGDEGSTGVNVQRHLSFDDHDNNPNDNHNNRNQNNSNNLKSVPISRGTQQRWQTGSDSVQVLVATPAEKSQRGI